MAAALRATVQMSAFLMVALVARWLADRSADAMIDAIRGEAAGRQRLAAAVLAAHAFSSHPNGHHIWMALPRGWGRTEFASHVQHHALIFATSMPNSTAFRSRPTIHECRAASIWLIMIAGEYPQTVRAIAAHANELSGGHRLHLHIS